MARRFRGESTCKVDQKGRINLPPQFRRAIEEGDPGYTAGGRPSLLLVYGDDSFTHVMGYTQEAMETLERRIERMPSSDLKRRLQKQFGAFVQEVEVDADGRILMAPKVRDRLGNSSEIYLLAAGDTFKIWNPDAYARVEQAAAGAYAAMSGDELLDAMDSVLAGLGDDADAAG